MISYDEAIKIVLDTVTPLPPIDVPLEAAVGHVLAEPVKACWDLPPADNSAMDGFAFAYAGQDEGGTLTLIGSAFAGHPLDQPVAAGEAAQITTGAPLPPGTDTVIPLEEVEERQGSISLLKAPIRGQHVRYRGEEFRNGEELLSPGTELRPGEIALLASAGITRVSVHPRARVAILSTGDELVELGETPGPGQIVNSNLPMLCALLRDIGCEPLPLGIGRDTPDALEVAIRAGLQADLLLSTGGVSVGEKDHMQETLNRLGFERRFWRARIKPGKPILFGTLQGKPVFGLPGNPAATGATFEIFVRPALRRLAGQNDPLPPKLRCTLAEKVKGGNKRRNFLWCRLEEENGRYRAIPSQRQGSGQNRSLQEACALLPIPVESPDLEAGSEVEVLLLRLPPGRTC
ncbi:molybdopterin molybdenumtransferase MoeA [Geothermobacter hydrogeniphilus]|uniref:Molybdopterin molybdenumtransferase n=1 Tax=Geothermobacter hydrogeniphilus TaxID=1969733 RepID=A0A2K2HCH6_9BACT|nr:gephyrin-like molybdotransferase Glp [Geothermobacter hydrogeniphilus]PNU20980.1 molybdopterin molybdenumtransferase MoeA [Geothermobacter hydrogeniphilus]